MWATEIIQHKEQFADGSILSIVIWLLPSTTAKRPHGYKYRLNYCTSDGTTQVRYDNKTGKGDHKHIGTMETTYEFESLTKLIEDFYADVKNARDIK